MKYIVSVITLFVGVTWWLYLTMGCGVIVSDSQSQEIEKIEYEKDFEIEMEEEYLKHEPEPKTEEKEIKIIDYVLRMIPVVKKKRLATTYSKWDSPKEEKGIYSNQKFANYLPFYERRINTEHYGVALCLTDAKYHNRLIQLPNGKWTHKYRVHVPHYNTDIKPTILEASERSKRAYYSISDAILDIAKSRWYSHPRDRMSHDSDGKNHNGRCDYCEDNKCIDVLHTGYRAIVKQKQKKWMNSYQRYLVIEFEEIALFAIYSDGTEKQIKLKEVYASVSENSAVRIIEVPGGTFLDGSEVK